MRRLRHALCLVALTTAIAFAAGACGGGGSSKKTATNAGAQTITIQNFKFNPDKLRVNVGDKVTVTNLDAGTPHSLTADDKSFDTGVFQKSDGAKTIALKKAGTFRYVCSVHTFMKGTITVS